MRYLQRSYGGFKARTSPPPHHHCKMELSMGLPGFFLGILCAAFVGQPMFHAGINVFLVFLACISVVALMAMGSMFGIAALEDHGHARRTRITEQDFVDLPVWIRHSVGDAVANMRQALHHEADETVISGLHQALVTICAAAADQNQVSSEARQGVLDAIGSIGVTARQAKETAMKLQAPIIEAEAEAVRALEQAQVRESDLQIFSALTAADIIVDTTMKERELS